MVTNKELIRVTECPDHPSESLKISINDHLVTDTKSHPEDRYFRNLVDSRSHTEHFYHTVTSIVDIQHTQVRLLSSIHHTDQRDDAAHAHHEASSAQYP